MPENIGDNLKSSILMLMNKIKHQYKQPEFMSMANIISFWKGKGAKDDLESERGIFILSILRMIKDRLIYNDIYKDIYMSDSQVGARCDYSIRNHLFVLYSVLNSVKQKESPPVDIHMYDLYKCFDTLWLEQCCNDLYEAGVQNDKLAMIYEGNQENLVAVKTPIGLTKRVEINSIVTQGGVLGPILCAVQTDMIGKQSLLENKHLYMYKGKVGIPSLAMIDDVAKVSLCGVESIKDNAFINSNFEQNKLLLNESKCHNLHCGKSSRHCPHLKARSSKISQVEEEKYVGDIVSHDAKHHKNVKARRSKGIGVVNEIMNILENLCIGPHYFKVALTLRESMLVQVLLSNADTWLRLTKEDTRTLERVDEMLLRKVMGTPRSTPIAALYLETGAVPLQYIIKRRRIMYLHHILTRDQESLIARVLSAQLEQPAKGDWCVVVQEDMEALGINITLNQVAEMSKNSLKLLVDKQVKHTAFQDLLIRKQSLSKLSGLEYTGLEMQQYLLSKKIDRHKRLEFSWRTRMIRVGWNYGKREACPFCEEEEDRQEHLLTCSHLNTPEERGTSVNFSGLVVRLETALRRREMLLERNTDNHTTSS
jgi:hypothetical protein